MTKSGLVLAVNSGVHRFSSSSDDPHGRHELEELLYRQRHTRPYRINEKEDVLIGDDGLIQGRYQLTTSALYKLCSEVCPGLGKTLASLSGLLPSDEQLPTNPEVARRMWNTVARLRLDTLKKYSLVLDPGERRVEGIVGPKYVMVTNHEFYQMLQKYFSRKRLEVEFYDATMFNRRMMVRFKSSPIFKLGDLKYSAGWSFWNSELGDSCARGTASLICDSNRTACLLPEEKKAKVYHRKGGNTPFRQGLTKLMDTVGNQVDTLPTYQDILLQAQRTPLQMPLDSKEREKREKELASLLKKVSRRKHNQLDYRAVIRSSVLQGRDSDDAYSLIEPANVRESSVFDLYTQVGLAAKGESTYGQEAAEAVAYQVLHLLQKGEFECPPS